MRTFTVIKLPNILRTPVSSPAGMPPGVFFAQARCLEFRRVRRFVRERSPSTREQFRSGCDGNLLPAHAALGLSSPALPALCQRNSSFCLAVVGQIHANTTQSEVSRFMDSLLQADARTPPLGTYGIHNCANARAPQSVVTCYLWPAAPQGNFLELETAFKASKLFRTVKARIPTP